MSAPLHILSVVGARPNFMKIAPFAHAIERHNTTTSCSREIRHTLLHSGQHYDNAMSNDFFRALNIPEPDINLGIGSGTHAEQVGNFREGIAQANTVLTVSSHFRRIPRLGGSNDE